MNNEMPEEVLSRYITEEGMHPKMFYGMLKKEVVIGEEAFWVKDAISTYLQKDESIRVIDVIYKNKKSIRVIDKRALEKYLNSYVCGIIIGEDKDERQRLYIDAEQEAPVQIIPWAYISERNAQSLIDYFSDSCSSAESVQTIHCNEVPLLGTSKNPGHIIIYDTIEGGEVFLKGFLSVGGGDGQIQYSNHNIRIWGRRNGLLDTDSSDANSITADFSDVVNFNQSGLMRWNGKCFLMLVPRSDVSDNVYMQRDKHSVLDYSADSGKWLPLPFVNDNGDSKGPEDVNIATYQGLLGNGMAMDGSSVGEDAADAVGEQPPKGVQYETEADKMYPAIDPATNAMSAVPTPGSNIEPNDESNPEYDSEEKPQLHKGEDDRSPEESERAFLKGFKNYVKEECGFNYDDRDLERFHTCVKTGMMTLLGGDPGSGKSSLFELYARALAGDSKNCNFKQVDVNPTWMEPSDLMGYSTPNLNNSNGEKQFHESQCGLRSFLADLKGADERAPALVCFEEMNLARIELYFAEFIQLISRYELTSTKKNLPSYGGDDKQAPLIIPSDVRFVGTCNDDPTVKPMSNRFFDRSNFIRLSGDSKEWKRTSDEKKKNDTTASDGKEESPQEKGTFCLFARESGRIGECKSTMVSAKDYGSWIKNPSREDSLKVGKKLDNILNEIRKELSAIVACPSPRVIGEILRYVYNRPFPAGVTDDTIRVYIALDEALVQRVISKCVPNALMRGKFEAAAQKVRETFKTGFKSAQENGEEMVSLTAERLDELEMETKSLFQWSGVEDDSNVNNAE